MIYSSVNCRHLRNLVLKCDSAWYFAWQHSEDYFFLLGFDFQTALQTSYLTLVILFPLVGFCFQRDYCTKGWRMLYIKSKLKVDSVACKDIFHSKFSFWFLRYLDSKKLFLLVQIKCLLCFCIDTRKIL